MLRFILPNSSLRLSIFGNGEPSGKERFVPKERTGGSYSTKAPSTPASAGHRLSVQWKANHRVPCPCVCLSRASSVQSFPTVTSQVSIP